MNSARGFTATLATVSCILAVPLFARAGVPTEWRNECIGYYSVALPGDFEYGLVPIPVPMRLNNAFMLGPTLPAWHSAMTVEIENPVPLAPDPNGQSLNRSTIYLSSEAKASDLKDIFDRHNSEMQKGRDELLEKADYLDKNPSFAKDSDPEGRRRLAFRSEAGEIPFYKLTPNGQSFFFPPGAVVDFHTMFANRILSTTFPMVSKDPQQTIAIFMAHFHPRDRFEMPTKRGVCIPYGLITEAKPDAHISLSMRLKDRPDIVVSLDAQNAADHSDDPHHILEEAYLPNSNFIAVHVEPLGNRLVSFRKVEIDGHQGLGTFALLTRRPDAGSSGLNNPANGNKDWGYIAYVPGDPKAPAGSSFTLTLKVERFSRFAKTAMTESQFRELVSRVIAGIKRRPIS